MGKVRWIDVFICPDCFVKQDEILCVHIYVYGLHGFFYFGKALGSSQQFVMFVLILLQKVGDLPDANPFVDSQ